MLTTLRTGAQVATPVLRTAGIILDHLMQTDPIAVYELVMLARGGAYVQDPEEAGVVDHEG